MKRLAIVGSGISGMICAHYLKEDFEITIFEQNDYVGGHTHTHTMNEAERTFTLDTGFIVFNLKTYPTLLRLFAQLGVARRKSDMSFSVHNKATGLQYSSYIPKGLFAQRSNVFSTKFWGMIRDIDRFNKIARTDYANLDDKQTISEYCRRNGLSDYFLDNYLVPISAAVWSTPQSRIYDFPISLLLPFFFNHGLLSTTKHHQWYTVKGGSNTYTQKIIEQGNFDIHLSEQVISVQQTAQKVKLRTKKADYSFDRVILASHSDESLTIAHSIPVNKRTILEKYTYTPNQAVLHTDERVMPPNRKAWASWNHSLFTKGSQMQATTTYWLNNLQDVPVRTNYFLSLNPQQAIAKDKVIKKIRYHHPLFTTENFALQSRLSELNENTRVYFAGAYFRYGFHEDGARAGMSVVKKIKEDIK